ncbi:MAG: trigger factor [Deltaproteobacteria bacterium]|nr:trigger factor [Deltaproteobacteria bacterium]
MGETTVAVKVEDISPVKKKLLFDISWVDVKNELDACYRDMNRKAKIKGFRPGKVPRKILESMYKDHVEGEAITNLVNKHYWDAVKEKGIIVVAQPDIDQNGIEEEKRFVFAATVEVEPIIEPKNYIGLELKRHEKNVTESDIEERLQQIRHMFGTMEEVGDDREVEEGDFAVIDFTGTLDGEALKEMTAENYLLEIGSGSFVPGFEDQVIGMRKDQSKQIQVKFPDEYGIQRIAGKDIVFSVTLKSIKEKILPEIDENFIRNFEKFETLEDLRTDIRETLEEENKARSNTDLKDLIVTTLLESNEFEAPPSFIERQIYYMIADTRRRMASRGLSRKEIDELSAKYKEMYRDEATKVVKSVLLMKNVAAKESISVDVGEIDERVMEMAQRRGQDFESFKKSLEDADMIENIKEEILTRKVFDFIEGKATIHSVNKEEIQQGGK